MIEGEDGFLEELVAMKTSVDVDKLRFGVGAITSPHDCKLLPEEVREVMETHKVHPGQKLELFCTDGKSLWKFATMSGSKPKV